MKKFFVWNLVVLISVLSLAPTYFGKPKTGVYESALRGVNYSVYVPENFDQNKKYPLILALHGHGGEDSKSHIGQWLEEAKQRECILVCPESKGIQENQPYPDMNWNWDGVHSPNDTERLLNFLPSIVGKYNIDPKKILLIGTNEAFCLELAINNPNNFSAIVMVNGYILKKHPPDHSVWTRQASTDSYTVSVIDTDKLLQYSSEKEKQMPILLVNQKNNQYIPEEDVRGSVDRLKSFGYDASYEMVDSTASGIAYMVFDWFESKVGKKN